MNKKTIIAFLLSLICVVLIFFSYFMYNSCSNAVNKNLLKDGFERVSSIRYCFNEKWVTENSAYIIECGGYDLYSCDIISKNEYEMASSLYKIGLVYNSPTALYSFCKNIISQNGSYSKKYIGIGEYLYCYNTDNYSKTTYYKTQVTGHYFSFVYVKVVNSNTIKVKYSENGTETTYNVSGYSIDRFEKNVTFD